MVDVVMLVMNCVGGSLWLGDGPVIANNEAVANINMQTSVADDK